MDCWFGSGIYDFSGGYLQVSTLKKGLGQGVFNWTGGELAASVISFDITNSNGTLNPAKQLGLLTINGSYTQSATSTLNIQLGGDSSSYYDNLEVSGFINLDGALLVTKVNGYEPSFGDNYTIFHSVDSLSGEFDTLKLPTLNPSLYWVTANLYSSGMISVNSIDYTLDTDGDGIPDVLERDIVKPTVIQNLTSHLLLWLDASFLSNFILNPDFTINKWFDYSGNNYHVTQNQTGKYPSYVSNGRVGKGVVKFDGVSEFLSSTLQLGAISELTIISVLKSDHSGTNFGFVYDSGSYIAPMNGIGLGYYQNGATIYAGDSQQSTTNFTRKGYTMSIQEVDINSFHRLSLDGESVMNDTSFNSSLSVVDDHYFTLGRESHHGSSGIHYFSGELAELIVVRKILNSTELSDIQNYLITKWGLTSGPDYDGDGVQDYDDAYPYMLFGMYLHHHFLFHDYK